MKPRFFVPEVLQTSLMDCGPATLKSVFDGFGRPINMERLRERCQTDVDGTSLSAMQRAAERLGLRVAQIMLPRDSVLLPEAACLPAIAFLRNPDGLLHFVTVWNVIGPRVQIMDPSRGRVWMRRRDLVRRLATIRLVLPEAKWSSWARGDDFAKPLLVKLDRIGVGCVEAHALLASAKGDPSPRSLAALDAATRMVARLVDADAVPRGDASRALLRTAFESDRLSDTRSIPDPYWICSPGDAPGTVVSEGAVLLAIDGVRGDAETLSSPGSAASAKLRTTLFESPRTDLRAGQGGVRASLWAGPAVPREVLSELRAATVKPHRVFLRLLWEDSRLAVVLVLGLGGIGAAASVLDALMMRGISDLVGNTSVVTHRVIAIASVLAFLLLALLFELAEAHLLQRLARGLETRIRVAFLEKLPRIEDRYFRSRSVSDMASRAHLLQTLRAIPAFAVRFVTGVLQLLATAGVVVWLEPRLWKLALLLLVLCLAVPACSLRLLEEALARMRVQGTALFRFYLDALLGAVPIRVHGAERAVRREHEAILTDWVKTSRSIETRTVAMNAASRVVGTLVAIAIVVSFVHLGGDLRALLLIAYFAQRLPSQAEALVGVARGYPRLEHDALRLFEPLAASETGAAPIVTRPRRGPTTGVDLVFAGITAAAGGRAIVSSVDLAIRPGSHVAIVGPSGAGKSSLVGILLGWLFVTEGRVLVDGRPLDATRLVQLRAETAWVDPAVQLWNASLLENLLYGHGDDGLAGLEGAMNAGDLLDVAFRLPDGLASPLGEGGAKVSGGQGQRVRLGRAILKRDARLVILDEPFRGLERDKRRALLRSARTIWKDATLLYVSHDVRDTLEMDRVLVVDGGRVVEDAPPNRLMAEDSFYRKLVAADQDAVRDVWGRPEWRRLSLEDGELGETR